MHVPVEVSAPACEFAYHSTRLWMYLGKSAVNQHIATLMRTVTNKFTLTCTAFRMGCIQACVYSLSAHAPRSWLCPLCNKSSALHLLPATCSRRHASHSVLCGCPFPPLHLQRRSTPRKWNRSTRWTQCSCWSSHTSIKQTSCVRLSS